MWPHLWCDPFPLQARILLALSYSGLAQATTAAANSGTQLIHALSGRQSFTELFPPSAFTFFLFPLLRCLMWEEQADTNVVSTAEQEEFLVSALKHSELRDPLEQEAPLPKFDCGGRKRRTETQTFRGQTENTTVRRNWTVGSPWSLLPP